MPRTFTTAGKSILFALGVGFGLLRGLQALGVNTRNSSGIGDLEAKLDNLHLAVTRLADQTEQFRASLDSAVTKRELAERVDRVFGPLESAIDARFAHQARSVEALRLMVGQTDALLQRVLDGLESMRSTRELMQDVGA